MNDQDKSLIHKLQPYLAIMIFVMLLIMGILLYQDNQLKKEISKNCGWGEEDYVCYCEHSDINRIKNELGINNPPWGFHNVSVVR